MSANAIRRSDDKATEKYSQFASKLEKLQEQITPKFYEYGKSVTYQEDDAVCLPTFTTNMITLSQIDEKLLTKTPQNITEDNVKQARAAKRRIVANILDEEELSNIETDNVEIENTEEEMVASIQAMLSGSTVKSSQPMNKMSVNIIQGLINNLKIASSQKEWFNAQVDNGIVNTDIFMRNLKNALKNGVGV